MEDKFTVKERNMLLDSTKPYYFKAAYFGFIVGDTLGVPYKLKENQEPGTWSGNTSSMLATMQAIINKNGMAQAGEIKKQLVNFIKHGMYTIDGVVFDTGITVTKNIMSHARKKNESYFVNYSKNSNDNSAIIRMLPIAFLNTTDFKTLSIAKLTNNHFISDYCCLEYINIIRHRGKINNLFRDIAELSEEEVKSTNYVMDTLEAIIWCITNTDNYKDAVLKAISLGGNTNTLAALVGSIAGCLYGYEDIPKEWIDNLKMLEYLNVMYEEFIKVLYY